MNHTNASQPIGTFFFGQPRTLLYDREGAVVSHSFASSQALLDTLSTSMIGRIRGYWESPMRALCCTFSIELIDGKAYYIPRDRIDLGAYSYPEEDVGCETGHILIRPCENMAEVCTEVPNPGTLVIVGSPKWRDMFRTMNGSKSPLARNIRSTSL